MQLPRDVRRAIAWRLHGLSVRPVVTRRAPRVADIVRRWSARGIIDEPGRLYEFWRQEAPEGNDPVEYLGADHYARSRVLASLLEETDRQARILEIGCNVGRNLAVLKAAGFTNVEGVEINPHAVELLRASYPELADNAVHVGPAEEVLSRLESDSYELVFTMAVLEHIHPAKARTVFDHLVRVGKRVVTIEPAAEALSHRQYPHALHDEFLARGLSSQRVVPMPHEFEGELVGLDGYNFTEFTRSQ